MLRTLEQCLPPAVRAEFNQQVAPELGAGAALVKAVEMLTISSDSKRPQELGALYARIAEKAWAIEQNKNANQAPVRSEQTPD